MLKVKQKMKYSTIAKCWTLAALLMFVAATFQIADENFVVGAICFGAAACFMAAAAKYRKKEAEENIDNDEEPGSNE